MARNWDELGIVWVADTVAEQVGDNATSRRELNVVAQLPRIVDIDKATAAGIDVLAWVNSANSMRVRAQSIARDVARKGGAKDAESIREKVYAALRGVRSTSGGGTVVVEKIVEKIITKRMLPNGDMYEGDDENEFRQLAAAAMVDLGMDAADAIAKSNAIAW